MADTVVYQLGVGAAGQQTMIPLKVKDNGDGTFSVSDSAAAGLPTSLGQKTAANSTSVVLASDQGAVPVVLDAAALAALETIQIGSIAAGSAIIGKVGIDQTTPGTTDRVTSAPNIVTIKTTVTRPADTTAYAANDAFANSTSAPTVGGYTFSNAARSSGGTGTITGAIIGMSGGSAHQGEIWVFDQSVTVTNDNTALSVSDADILNLIGVIPFNCTDVTAANAISYVDGLAIDFTCVGSANLRFLVKVITAFTPASAEVLSIALKVRN